MGDHDASGAGALTARARLADRRRVRRLALLGAAVVGLAGLAALTGTYDVTAADFGRALARRLGWLTAAGPVPVSEAVAWNLRAPRVLLALCVGAALASAGAVFQAGFRNPLVEPYILGVSSGAAFGAALGMVVPQFPLSVQAAAFAGALVAVGLVHAVARTGGETPVVTLVLSGIIIGSVFSAGVSILKYVAQDAALRDIVFWLLGGFYFATWRDVAIVGPSVALAVGVMTAGGWALNVLTMGDHQAQSLGVHPGRTRAVLVAAATAATAVSVAATGIVPWVGLLVPHAARLLLGPDNRLVVPGSALLGAGFLLACDTAARGLTSAEIPVGIVTALAGAPFIAWLIRRRGSRLFG